MIGVPLVVLLVAVVAWFAVRGSLRTVAAITAKVGEINATEPRARVPVPRTGDELTSLAHTMNDMLRRVAESVDRQHQFVADASHELRTPLTSMRTQLEVLFAHPDRIDWRHAIENMQFDVERMQQLVSRDSVVFTWRCCRRVS
jgi:signal transduction histidine kinase